MISLIVCTVNRTEELARLFSSLEAQTDRRFEVVLVDQNPAGFLQPVLERTAARLPLRRIESAKGLSRARNVGLAHARFEIVSFPDDDCWYPPRLVEDVLAAFDAMPEMGVLLGRTADKDGRDSVSAHPASSGPLRRSAVFQAGNSNSVFVRTAMARACGGFDESLGVGAGTQFGSGEETEFLLRCLRRGARIHHQRHLVVHHDQVLRDPLKITAYARGFGRVCRLHGLGAQALAPRVARAALRSALLTAKGRRAEARERWAWIAGSVRGYLARPDAAERKTTRRPG